MPLCAGAPLVGQACRLWALLSQAQHHTSAINPARPIIPRLFPAVWFAIPHRTAIIE